MGMAAFGVAAASALGYQAFRKNGLECDVTTSTTTTTTSTSGAGGKKAKAPIDVSGLTYKAKHDDNLLPDPPDAKYRVALVGCYVDSLPGGGSDKVHSCLFFDTIGIATASTP